MLSRSTPLRIAAFVLLVPHSAAAAVSFADVQALCRAVTSCPDRQTRIPRERVGALKEACAVATSASTARWEEAWKGGKFPTAAELKQADACPGAVPGAAGAAQLESSLLWGTTEFVLTRAEQELRTWVIDEFLGSLCGKELGRLQLPGNEGRPLFPRTCELVQKIHLRGFGTGLASLRAAMRQDLLKLPALLFSQAAAAKGASSAEVDAALVGFQSASVMEDVLAGANLIAAFRGLPEHAIPTVKMDCSSHPAAATVFVSSVLASTLASGAVSTSIQIPNGTEQWGHAFMAVAMSRRDDPALTKAWPRCEAHPELGFDVGPLLSAASGIQAGFVAIRKASEDYGSAMQGDVAPRDVYARLAEGGAAVLSSVLGAVDAARFRTPLAVLEGIRGASRVLADEDYAAFSVYLLGAAAACGVDAKLPKDFVRIAAFGVDVAQAHDTPGVVAALERAAAPEGAYRRKRMADGAYWSINAYFGGMAAVEYAKQADGKAAPAFAPGFWLPVGIEVGGAGKGASYGVFLQAVDLGVLASWRIKNDDLDSAPRVAFSSVLSPGAFFSVGLPRAPISITVGAAFAPRLRTVAGLEGARAERDAFRLGVAVGTDLPIFN